METELTTVRNGRLIYRGVDAVRVARNATVEDTAALLWHCAPLKPVRPRTRLAEGETGKARAFEYLSQRAATAPPLSGATRDELAEIGAELLIGFADAVSGIRGRGLFHQRLARFWGLDPNGVDLLRRTLVLVADHELNPSSFSARVTASTGASLAACALSGYATLTGPRHGEASARALEFLKSQLGRDPNKEACTPAGPSDQIPAIGHALYPKGDPRAKSRRRRKRGRGGLTPALTRARSLSS